MDYFLENLCGFRGKGEKNETCFTGSENDGGMFNGSFYYKLKCIIYSHILNCLDPCPSTF